MSGVAAGARGEVALGRRLVGLGLDGRDVLATQTALDGAVHPPTGEFLRSLIEAFEEKAQTARPWA